MRNFVPIALAALALVACGTTPPLPGFGVEVSVKLVPGGRQVCIAGKNFTPDASVQTGYIDIPGAPALTPAQTVTAAHDGSFNVVDINTGHAVCSADQTRKSVLVFAKDLSNDNVAIGKLSTNLWCFDAIQVVVVDPRCP